MPVRNTYSYAGASHYSQVKKNCPIDRGCEHCTWQAGKLRVLETDISSNPVQRAAQLDENPGLWLRLHGNIRSLILPDVLET